MIPEDFWTDDEPATFPTRDAELAAAVDRLEARTVPHADRDASEDPYWPTGAAQRAAGAHGEASGHAETGEALRGALRAAWDAGYAVATDDFVHSDYCGRRCQCEGLHGTTNPYRNA